ncbi:MAG: hypothetical protein JSR59_23365 [Proteobacteria bacterium]|nr:hypothetical protein [Pseudomonadota bacterium]
MHRVIHLHAEAPGQPLPGQPCNGCGVCCASEPCPLGILATGRRHGACAALVWSDDEHAYRCGFLTAPAEHLPAGLRWSAPLVARYARRAISAGSGCDCTLERA